MCLQWHTMRSISQQHIMDLTCLSSSLEKLLCDIIECSIYVKQSLLTWKTKFIVTIYLMMCSLSLQTDEGVPADRLFHFLLLKVVSLWLFFIYSTNLVVLSSQVLGGDTYPQHLNTLVHPCVFHHQWKMYIFLSVFLASVDSITYIAFFFKHILCVSNDIEDLMD